MKLALIILGLITLLELLLWTPLFWRIRKVVACLLIVSLAVVSGLFFGAYPSVWTGMILFFSIYRLINLLRVLESRLHPDYLYHATVKTSWWLIFFQLLVLGGVGLDRAITIPGLTSLYILAACQFAAALVLFVSTHRHLRKIAPATSATMGNNKLPTLSVAIPARNESDDLEACLQSLIASDYEKLEILVLDDCSQSRRTPEIISSYAHDGVRFISGKVPPKDWLAKNYAYEQLAEAANGDILLFCGVDARFAPGSLRAMVQGLLQKNKMMASYIPSNHAPSSFDIESLLVQPARYAWELALPRRLFNRPPVLSTCWLITKDALQKAGGFTATRRSISPESHFARHVIRNADGYSFTLSDATTDLNSAKSVQEQRDTAIRTRYPQLHRRPELVALVALLEIFGLVGPLGLLLGGLAGQNWPLASCSALTCLLLAGFYARVVSLTYRHFLVRGLWTLPLVAIYDVGLLNYSMWRYEFREVIWKDRNICMPVMQVIPRLPTTPSPGKRH